MQEVQGLAAEAGSLDALLGELSPADWERPTPFKNWTPWDVIAHLHSSDRLALASLRSREEFQARVAPLMKAIGAGKTLVALTRAEFAGVQAPALRAAWRETLNEICNEAKVRDPDQRLAWFGPDMDARTFIVARYMETWAHGQEIYDLLGRQRRYSDAIRAIATLGVRTYGFSFANRGREAPRPKPYLRLVAPSGAIWEYNEPSQDNAVQGVASDFCHVVTQGRNITDTELAVTGEPARQWMAIAQCFAGPPEDPPAPGARGISE